jgi:hypothetical protein
MASLRKRAQPRIAEEAAFVTTAPTAGAKLTEPAAEQTAPATNPVDAAKDNPVEQAAESELKKRISELERAEALQSEALTQQVQYARERQQQVQNVPEHIRARGMRSQ